MHWSRFEQWGRNIALTSEGREFYTHAQLMIAASNEAERVMAELCGVALGERMLLENLAREPFLLREAGSGT
ncbi:MAG: hypothetical protein NVS4B11_36620 [Ktedonobacteraceae bacterium]